jgi:Ca2+-binding RTX toxin-like protein
MSGGSGSDTFTWQADESGTDIITDFNPVEGDALNIADLLVGENNPTAEELDGSYMSISSGASTTITIFGDSGNADQVIELAGYDTTGLTGVEILNNLLAGGNLITD